ncbi:MAG: DUF6588 family protein [Bacteroidota bacterium]|nr:DUF6588 family protein [Bacteroidota bacterium]
MKKLNIIILILISYVSAFSQQNILQNNLNEGEKLIEAYFTPMAETFGAGLNNAWYNTAKPHSILGFDVTFSLNTVIIPNSAENFMIEDNFNGIFTSSDEDASTIFGSMSSTQMNYNPGNNLASSSFNMPGGLKTPILPLPMIQAGIGVYKKTSLDIRYMPILNVGDNININLYGFGAKHDLLQWIPAVGNVIPMSLSIQAGYTNLNTELKVAGQEVALNTKATTLNLIASKKVLMLTGYAGIGYSYSNTNFSANPNFDLNGLSFDNELDISFESTRKLRTNLGLRLNIALMTIHADYTFADYPTATIGVGVSLR